jgi:ribose/xylose/arabinose/galactoside ABC-type transport system permease subunit
VNAGAATAAIRPPRRIPGWLPLTLVAGLMVGVGGWGAAKSSVFLTEYNLTNLLYLALPLGFAAVGQASALLVGGFDISVGAVMTLVVVVGSGLLTTTSSAFVLVLGALALVALGLFVGFVNAFLIRVAGLPSIIATLATLSVLQGIALALRPYPSGQIDYSTVDALNKTVAFVPVAFIALVVLAVLADVFLYLTPRGLTARAVGLDESSARRLGAPSSWIHVRAFVFSALMATVGGFFLAAGIFSGVGTADPGISSSYALTSIAAAVLGGAGLTGGKGSFVGAVVGAVFLAMIVNILPLNVLPVHGLPTSSLELIITGALTLLAIVLYRGGELWPQARSAWQDLRLRVEGRRTIGAS